MPGSGSTSASTWSRSSFLLFDVELLFLYPWAVAQWSELVVEGSAVGIPAEFRGWVFWEIMVFIVILAAAFGLRVAERGL